MLGSTTSSPDAHEEHPYSQNENQHGTGKLKGSLMGDSFAQDSTHDNDIYLMTDYLLSLL